DAAYPLSQPYRPRLPNPRWVPPLASVSWISELVCASLAPALQEGDARETTLGQERREQLISAERSFGISFRVSLSYRLEESKGLGKRSFIWMVSVLP